LNQAEEFQMNVSNRPDPNVIRLQSVDPSGSKVKWDGKKPASISVDIKILHPDCLLVVEDMGVPTAMVIAKGEKYKRFRKTKFVRGVDPKCRLADFLHEICIDVCGEPYVRSKTLSSGNYHDKYKLVMVANCGVSEEVVTESNWNTLLQEKQKGTRWYFVLYLTEVYPAGESGEWETLPEKKSFPAPA
jgi:hypothetical protein